MQANPIPVAILVRVSTNKQENARQISELEAVAVAKGWQVVATVREQVSGSVRVRAGLDEVLRLAAAGEIRKVLVHEVSRVARRNSTAHDFIERLEDAGVSLYWHAQTIETLLPNGRRNPAASVMFSLLAEMARNEKETLVERIKSGLAEARRKGRKLGRPEGITLATKELLAKHADIVRCLKTGESVRHTAKITGKGGSTVQRVKAAMGLPKDQGP